MATREEAFRAGYANPLIGGFEPLQRLYGTVRAMGEELSGADMGTPFGTRFAASQKQSKAEAKRLKALREQFPEEFGRGQMIAGDVADPYMFGQGLPPMGMRPGVVAGPRALPGPGGRPMLAGPGMMEGEIVPPRAGYLSAPPPAGPRGLPPAAPAAPYYRTVPPEMGTSPGPMNAFNQNQVGMATGRYGTAGYAPEMAVTDFETYGPMGARPTPGPYAPSGFDRNMLEAFRAGRANYGRNVRPEPMGGGFTLEEMGQAVAPYRQGGLVYEPVGGAPQGASNLPMMAQGRASGQPSGGGNLNFGVTRGGMGAPPSGFDPRVAAAAGLGGYLAGAYNRGDRAATALSGEAPGGMTPLAPLMPSEMLGDRGPLASYGGNSYLFDRMYPLESAPMGERAPAETRGPRQLPPMEAGGRGKGRKKAEGQRELPGASIAMPQGQFDPNLNYYVTQALDRLFGQGEAERGRQYQEQMARQGYYY